MTGKYAVGVDVGGGSSKSAIYSLDGNQVGEGRVSYSPNQPAPGIAEYDPNELTRSVEQSLALALSSCSIDPADVVSIATDAMISGAVGLGPDGRPSTTYTTTLDTRFNRHLSHMTAHHESRIRELVGSGIPVVAGKIAWCRETFPDQFDRTQVFVTAGGLVGCHLAGLSAEHAFIDPTVFWAVGLSDTLSGTWSDELCKLLEVPLSVLPRIVAPTDVVGELQCAVASRTGFLAGTPVVAGAGDQAAGFVGAGVVGQGAIGESAGTYMVVGRCVSNFEPHPAGIFDVVPSALGNSWHQQTVIIGGGFTRAWFESRVVSGSDNDSHIDIDALASAASPGSDGAVFVPHLGGQNAPSRPSMRGAWLGLEWSHDRRHLSRSLMEAMAYETQIALTAMVASDDEDADVVIYGGGTQSPVATQIKADVTGRTYRSLGDIAPANLAAAMIGAVGVGEVVNVVDVLGRAAPLVQTFYPSPDANRAYLKLIRDYESAVDAVANYRRNTPIHRVSLD